jgi:hypothetical protein
MFQIDLTRVFSGHKRGDHSFHHGGIFVWLGRLVDEGHIHIAIYQGLGQGFKEFFGGPEMLALAFLPVRNAGKMGMKRFRQFF